jgi:hypothetical protein
VLVPVCAAARSDWLPADDVVLVWPPSSDPMASADDVVGLRVRVARSRLVGRRTTGCGADVLFVLRVDVPLDEPREAGTED